MKTPSLQIRKHTSQARAAKRRSPLALAAATFSLGAFLGACSGQTSTAQETSPVSTRVAHPEFAGDGHRNQARANSVEAELESMRGKGERGTLRFVSEGDSVRIEGSFSGLPKGTRALKILSTEDCDKVSRRSKDYNPTGAKHGPPSASERHVGDLGNIEVDANGKASFAMTTNSLTIEKDGPSSVLGRTVVITNNKDDGKSQPAGKAGRPIACGTIK